MLHSNIAIIVALELRLIHTPLDLKAFRQGKLASTLARGCFQRSPEAVTFGQEAGKNTIIAIGCFPTEGLEIHCPSVLLLRCLCFHISRFLSYCTFFLSFFFCSSAYFFPLTVCFISYSPCFFTSFFSSSVCFLCSCLAL